MPVALYPATARYGPINSILFPKGFTVESLPRRQRPVPEHRIPALPQPQRQILQRRAPECRMCLTRRPEGLLDAEMELPPVR